MSNNKESMGDIQFNGTLDEWEALVKKNKMSNNKNMKLYTEKEIKIFIETNIIEDEDDLALLLPIKLPSDEEIEDRSGFEYPAIQQDAFIGGAKWMRDKIQGGNNEQQ